MPHLRRESSACTLPRPRIAPLHLARIRRPCGGRWGDFSRRAGRDGGVAIMDRDPLAWDRDPLACDFGQG